VETRGLCHLNPVTLDVALHNADSKNQEATHGNRTSTGASEENNAALQLPGNLACNPYSTGQTCVLQSVTKTL